MESRVIDINADVGEGVGNEPQLMPYISSCNVACGGHSGDSRTMHETVELAKAHGVKIGAHPSFPDKENFGRMPMKLTSAALFTSIQEQIGALMAILKNEKLDLHHVKPHGALYNLAAVDKRVAAVIVEAVKAIAFPVKLYVPFKSVIAHLAIENNIPIVYEAFADRNYNDNLTLVNRKEDNALIQDADGMFKHVYQMVSNQKVRTISGALKTIKAETFCVHGDSQNVIYLVKVLFHRLKAHGIEIR